MLGGRSHQCEAIIHPQIISKDCYAVGREGRPRLISVDVPKAQRIGVCVGIPVFWHNPTANLILGVNIANYVRRATLCATSPSDW